MPNGARAAALALPPKVGKGEPVAQVVNACQQLLAGAEAGQIQGLVFGTIDARDQSQTGWACNPRLNLVHVLGVSTTLQARIAAIVCAPPKQAVIHPSGNA